MNANGSFGRPKTRADMPGNQIDLLGRQCLAGHLKGGAEGAGGKDGDAVDQQLAPPGELADMHAQHRVDMQIGAEAEGLGDLGGLPPQCVQGAVQGPAAMPEPPGRVVQVAAVAFGVDHEDPGGADDQVVEVGGRAGYSEVVEDKGRGRRQQADVRPGRRWPAAATGCALHS